MHIMHMQQEEVAAYDEPRKHGLLHTSKPKPEGDTNQPVIICGMQQVYATSAGTSTPHSSVLSLGAMKACQGVTTDGWH